MIILYFFNLKSKDNFCMIILLSFKSLLCILDNSLSPYVSFENILSQFVVCLVILLILSFLEQKFLIVMKLGFFIISFMDYVFSVISKGLPQWLSGKESACQCRRLRKRRGRRFNPWVRKILGKRKWQPTPVFLPGKILWTEEPGGLQSMGTQRVRYNLAIEYALILYLKRHQHTQGHVDFLLCCLLRVLLFYGLYLGL